MISVCGAIGVQAEYASHAPIRINSNAEFDSDHGVTGGDGSESDPWVIEYYDINGTGFGNCIYVGNTTDYFVVKRCNLHDASGNADNYHRNSGLFLYNVSHGLVENVSATFNVGHGGILLQNSNNNKIYHVTGSYNVRGVYLYYSDNNIITYNDFTSNTLIGVFGLYSDDNNIEINRMALNTYGIWFSSSCGNSIDCNNLSSNTQYGMYIYATSTGNNVHDNYISSNSYGIYLSTSSAIDNIIHNNTMESNTQYGVYLSLSGSNAIYHNNFLNNTNQAYDTGTDNTWDDGYPSGGNYWSDYDGTDGNGDGIGDAPYVIDSNSQDDYPLMKFTIFGLGMWDDPLGLGMWDDPI